MGKHKKAFIDRKSAVSFRLVHRSQKDPLIADDSLGEGVFEPISPSDAKKLEERQKFGIYYRDDYDYLCHLKEVGETVDLIGDEPIVEREVLSADLNAKSDRFSSCIFETHGVELRVGMLNRAAPSNELLPDFDPDIVAALDGEIGTSTPDEEDELEDDFVAKANAPVVDGGAEVMEEDRLSDYRDERRGRDEIWQRFGFRGSTRNKYSEDENSTDDDDEREDKETDLSDQSTEADERKTTFTNYSMSSSVIRRPDGLRIIDDHFETLFETEYGEHSAEDDDDAQKTGGRGGGTTTKPSADREDERRILSLLEEQGMEGADRQRFQRQLPDAELKGAILRYAKEAEHRQGERTEDLLVDSAKRSRWDCESVLSTCSTLYNHPTVIREPMRGDIGGRRRTGKRTITREGQIGKSMPEEMEVDGGDCCAAAICLPSSVRTRISSANTIRPKGETAEERRTHKSAVKEERKERRKEKKTNKETFRAERLRLESQRRTAQPKTRPIQ